MTKVEKIIELMGQAEDLNEEEKENKEIVDKIFKSRQKRETHPYGSFDKAGRWYPNEWEKQDCCSNIRSPSRSFPYSLMVHCRSKKHIKELVDNHSIEDLKQRILSVQGDVG